MQQGGSIKLAFLVVALSCPFVAKGQHRHHHHGKGHHRVKFHPLPPPPLAPTTGPPSPSLLPPPSIDNHMFAPPTYNPPSPAEPPRALAPNDNISPSPRSPPPLQSSSSEPPEAGYLAPEYMYMPLNGSWTCGDGPCLDSQYCDYPCPVCCKNRTCCYEFDYDDHDY